MLTLAWHYFRSRSLLTLSAVAIGLGVAVLFTVLSVMNGFLVELEHSVRTETGDAIIEPLPSRFGGGQNFETFQKALIEIPEIASLEPRLNYYGLVGRRGNRAMSDPRSSDLSGLLLMGKDGLDDPQLPHPPIWLGVQAAKRLGLSQGDTLEILSFQQSQGAASTIRASFSMAGTFQSGRFDHDLDRAHLRRQDLAKFLHHETGFSEIVLRASSGTSPETLVEKVETKLKSVGLSSAPFPLTLSWRRQAGSLLRAVEDQLELLTVIFFFIVLVAAYQLVATLTLTVAEKRRDIGVLRALGASPAKIVGFFVTLGGLIALSGSALGLLLGLSVSRHLDSISKWLGGGESLFRAEVYHFDHIPVAVDWMAITILVGATLFAAALFSLIPAWKAARLPVLETLWKR